MPKYTKRVLTILPIMALAPHTALAAEEHKVWRAADAEMGAVSWTGFTLTPEISDHTLHLAGAGSAVLKSPGGFKIGFGLGYDYQTQALVIGAIGEGFHTWMAGGGHGAASDAYAAKVPEMGSLRARLGYTHGRFLAYGTAGGAIARMTVEDRTRGLADSHRITGWTGGAGIEYAWNKHLTARIEYLHTSYRVRNFRVLPGAARWISSTMDPLDLHIAFRF